MKLFIFQLRVSDTNVEQEKLDLRISKWNLNLIFYRVKLVTRKKNFC